MNQRHKLTKKTITLFLLIKKLQNNIANGVKQGSHHRNENNCRHEATANSKSQVGDYGFMVSWFHGFWVKSLMGYSKHGKEQSYKQILPE